VTAKTGITQLQKIKKRRLTGLKLRNIAGIAESIPHIKRLSKWSVDSVIRVILSTKHCNSTGQ